MKNLIGTVCLAGILLLAAVLPSAAQPSNDNFADAALISGDSAGGTNVDATREDGEPSSVAWPGHERSALGGRSVWWRWVAPVSGRYTIRTGLPDNLAGSSTFDTQLGVYTGTAPWNLVEIASNESDVNLPSGLSSVEINALQGTTYYILVDGFEGQTGSISLYVGLTRYSLLAIANPSGAGVVTVNPPQPDEGYGAGTLVTLTAVPAEGQVFYGWSGGASGPSNSVTIRMNSTKTVIANFTFDSELVWQHLNGRVGAWRMISTNLLSSVLLGSVGNSSWRVAGSGDFNGDASNDLLFQHANGRLAVWLMNGDQIGSAVSIAGGTNTWRLVDAGNFSGDSQPDLLFQRGGRLAIWLMNGLEATNTILVTNRLGAGWIAVDAVDFDRDGDSDILFRHTTGRLAVWLMDGALVANGQLLGRTSPGWRLAGGRDFDSDGNIDLLFQSGNGRSAIWLMNGTTMSSAFLLQQGRSVPPGWSVRAIR